MAITIMDDLIDGRSLTGGEKTTFELIDNYLPIWKGHCVNGRLTCGGKTGPKMQVWNLLHAARWKHSTQKSRQKSPSGHHRTSLSGYIFATKACIDRAPTPWPYHRGVRGACTWCFWVCGNSRNSRNWRFSSKLDFFLHGNGSSYSYQNFTTYASWASPYNTIEILTLTPKNFGILGKTFLMVGPRCPKFETASARGPPPVQNKIVSGPLAQRTMAQWPPQKVTILKLSPERPTLGALVPPTWPMAAKFLWH